MLFSIYLFIYLFLDGKSWRRIFNRLRVKERKQKSTIRLHFVVKKKPVLESTPDPGNKTIKKLDTDRSARSAFFTWIQGFIQRRLKTNWGLKWHLTTITHSTMLQRTDEEYGIENMICLIENMILPMLNGKILGVSDILLWICHRTLNGSGSWGARIVPDPGIFVYFA